MSRGDIQYTVGKEEMLNYQDILNCVLTADE
jgi:hypothetical protein